MKIDRAAYPFLLATLAPTMLLVVARSRWSVILAGGAAFMAFFFRDPERDPPDDPDLVVSPADGRVVRAGDPEPGTAPAGSWQQVSVFLSPLDVHVNRSPWAGAITRVHFQRGRFLPAYRSEAARENERSEVWIEGPAGTVVFRQVVGVLARRVVCRVRPGDVVATGDRVGIMKFGSRMDVFVPPESTLLVGPGDRVRGGETPIARLTEALRAS